MNSSYLAFAMLFASASCLAGQLDGAALYRDNCSACHGERGMGSVVNRGAMMNGTGTMMNGSGTMMNGSGGKPGHGGPDMMGLKAPKLSGDASTWTPALFQRAVLQGIDDEGKPLNTIMPHWGSSSFRADNGKPPTKEEVDAIQQYLQTQK